MFVIDQYAYANKMRPAHPLEKFGFALSSLVISLAAASLLAPVAVALLMGAVVIIGAGIPARFYLRLLTLPLSFLLLSVTAVAVTVSTGAYPYPPLWWGFTLGPFNIILTSAGLTQALELFLKSLGAVSCLYFLSLTTPLVEVLDVLKRLRVPPFFLELTMIVYHSTFIFLNTAGQMHTSQASRLGYISLKTSYHSLAQLAANLFVKSYYHSRALYTSLLARGYEGQLEVLQSNYRYSTRNIFYIALSQMALLSLALVKTGGGILA